jgi:integrase
MTRATPNRRRLTDGFIRKLKPQQSSFLIHDEYQRGLAVRVEPTGSKSWVCIYNFQRRSRWYLIGKADAIDLAGARKLAGRVMFKVAEGQDPQAEKKAERNSGTFEELATAYVVKYAEKKNKSWRQADALVKRHLIPRWAKLPAAAVSRSDVRTMMSEIESRTVANQVLASASAIFTWANKNDFGNVKINPCRGVEDNETASRDRVLTATEVPLFWAEFDAADFVRGRALMFLLLTGQRPGEVRHFRMEHLKDGCWWEMPGAPDPKLSWPGTKNGMAHRVFLPEEALKIIQLLDSDGLVFAGARGKPIDKLEEVMSRICDKLKAERATPHDLRRSHGTLITSLGFSRDCLNRIQNHREGGIADVYDQHQYAEENRRVMETVAARIMSLIRPGPANVVVLNPLKSLKN